MRLTRQQFLRGVLAGLIVPRFRRQADDQVERRASEILSRIVEPSFPPAVFPVTGSDSEAFRFAIDACAAAGGGTVLVPEGDYFLNGPLELTTDNTRLHLQAGATLHFSTDPADYPLLDDVDDGTELMSLIFVRGKTNVGLTGEGETSTIDGQAEPGRGTWWSWSGKPQYGWQPDDPVESQGGWPKRPYGVQFLDCTNVLVRGVRTIRMPKFQFRIRRSQNVTVDRVFAMSSDGPNNDGVDPSSCTDVLIQNCRVDAGDDCFAVQAGVLNDGTPVPARNVLIQDSDLYRGHAAVAFGSTARGGISNVVARRLRLHDPAVAVRAAHQGQPSNRRLGVGHLRGRHTRCGRLGCRRCHRRALQRRGGRAVAAPGAGNQRAPTTDRQPGRGPLRRVRRRAA